MNPSDLFFIQRKRLSVDQVLDTHDLVNNILLPVGRTWVDITEIEFQNLILKAWVCLVLSAIVDDGKADLQ